MSDIDHTNGVSGLTGRSNRLAHADIQNPGEVSRANHGLSRGRGMLGRIEQKKFAMMRWGMVDISGDYGSQNQGRGFRFESSKILGSTNFTKGEESEVIPV